MYIKR